MSAELTLYDLQVLNTAHMVMAKLKWTQTELHIPKLGVFRRTDNGSMQVVGPDKPSRWVRALSAEGGRQLGEFLDSLLGEAVDTEDYEAELKERHALMKTLSGLTGQSYHRFDEYDIDELREYASEAKKSMQLRHASQIGGLQSGLFSAQQIQAAAQQARAAVQHPQGQKIASFRNLMDWF